MPQSLAIGILVANWQTHECLCVATAGDDRLSVPLSRKTFKFMRGWLDKGDMESSGLAKASQGC